MADIVNGRCHDEKAPEQGPPLFDNGHIIIQGVYASFHGVKHSQTRRAAHDVGTHEASGENSPRMMY